MFEKELKPSPTQGLLSHPIITAMRRTDFIIMLIISINVFDVILMMRHPLLLIVR